MGRYRVNQFDRAACLCIAHTEHSSSPHYARGKRSRRTFSLAPVVRSRGCGHQRTMIALDAASNKSLLDASGKAAIARKKRWRHFG